MAECITFRKKYHFGEKPELLEKVVKKFYTFEHSHILIHIFYESVCL